MLNGILHSCDMGLEVCNTVDSSAPYTGRGRYFHSGGWHTAVEGSEAPPREAPALKNRPPAQSIRYMRLTDSTRFSTLTQPPAGHTHKEIP